MNFEEFVAKSSWREREKGRKETVVRVPPHWVGEKFKRIRQHT
jgi:hypothetical protein